MICFGRLPKRNVPFLCVLAGILCLSVAPAASGFTSLRGLEARRELLINTLHKQHWNISYSYGDGCQPDDKNNDKALTEAITEVLQMWLEPLREYTDRPIVDDFRYVLDADPDASDLSVIFHCNQGITRAHVVDSPLLHMHKGTKVVDFLVTALAHEMGHAFGLGDTYVAEEGMWGGPAHNTGGLDSTRGTQPASLMSGHSFHRDGYPVLGKDDKNGVIYIYKVFHEGLSIRDCFFSDYVLEHFPFGCVPKHPLIFELKYGIEVRALRMLEEDENLDLNAHDADGMTVLHHAFINGYTKVVDALPREHFEKFDVNIRDAKGRTVLHYVVLLNNLDRATDVIERLLAHPKIKVNIRRSDGRTPAQLARDTGRFHLTKLIWEHPTAKLPPWSVVPKGKLATTWGDLKKKY